MTQRAMDHIREMATNLLAEAFVVGYQDSAKLFHLPHNADVVKGMLAQSCGAEVLDDKKAQALYMKLLPMVLEKLEMPGPWTSKKDGCI